MEWHISQRYMKLGHLFLTVLVLLPIFLILYFIDILTLQIFTFTIILVVVLDVGTLFVFYKVGVWDSDYIFYMHDDKFGMVAKEKNIYYIGPVNWEGVYHIKMLPNRIEILYHRDGKKYLAKFVYKDIFMNEKEKTIRKEIVEEIVKRAKAANINVNIKTYGRK